MGLGYIVLGKNGHIGQSLGDSMSQVDVEPVGIGMCPKGGRDGKFPDGVHCGSLGSGD